MSTDTDLGVDLSLATADGESCDIRLDGVRCPRAAVYVVYVKRACACESQDCIPVCASHVDLGYRYPMWCTQCNAPAVLVRVETIGGSVVWAA